MTFLFVCLRPRKTGVLFWFKHDGFASGDPGLAMKDVGASRLSPRDAGVTNYQ
jgi:hypothetical protein